jgi:hypothetical protein
VRGPTELQALFDLEMTRFVLHLVDAPKRVPRAELGRARSNVGGGCLLTPYQRVLFRIFEEDTERQKIELLLRVRRGGNSGRRHPTWGT